MLAIVDRTLYKKDSCADVKWLIWWEGLRTEEATWEDAAEFQKQFPGFEFDF